MKINKTIFAVPLGLILITILCRDSSFAVPQSNVAAANSEAALRDPAAMLANARTLFVDSRSGFVKSEVIESELQKRSDFRASGLLLTKNQSDADLVMEVRRSNFTTEYPFVVIDARTKIIVASGKVNSLFGTAAGKIAKRFSRQLQNSRKTAASVR